MLLFAKSIQSNKSIECCIFHCRMVLVLNGVLQEECTMDTHSLFMQHPVYRDTANQLLSIPIKTVRIFLDLSVKISI